MYANSGDSDHSAASDLGMHCLPMTLGLYIQTGTMIKLIGSVFTLLF